MTTNLALACSKPFFYTIHFKDGFPGHQASKNQILYGYSFVKMNSFGNANKGVVIHSMVKKLDRVRALCRLGVKVRVRVWGLV